MKHVFSGALALSCACIASSALAQTAVTAYGLLDSGLVYTTNANAAGDAITKMPSLTGTFPSRLGFRGTEDLGGGLTAFFVLENGLGLDTGITGQGGRLFGRQAWVGLAGNWGQVTIGRNYNMLYQSTFDVDIFGPSTYGLGALDPFVPNGRSDNSVAYKGSLNGVTVGATYSLGRDTSAAGGASGTNCAGESATDSSACREWSAMLRYDQPSWAIVGAYDRIYGGSGAAAGLISSALSDSSAHLAGFYKLGDWKVGGGAIVRNNEGSASTPRSKLFYLAAAYKLTPAITLDGQVGRLDYQDSANGANQVLVRAVYEFTKRTSTYVGLGRINNEGAAAVALSSGGSVGTGMGQTGVIAGIRHAF